MVDGAKIHLAARLITMQTLIAGSHNVRAHVEGSED